MRLAHIKNILSILLCLLHIVGLAQSDMDSIQRVLESKIADSTRVDLLLKLSQRSYNTDLKRSLSFAQEALKISEEKKIDSGIQRSFAIMSRIQRRLGNFSIAVEYNLKELSIAIGRKDTTGIIDSYTTLGNIHSSLENYQEARKNLEQAYVIARFSDAPSLSAIMNFIGRNFGKMHEYDSAEWWIKRSLEHELKFPQPDYTLSYIYNNLAEIYYLKKRYNEAIQYYVLSRKLPENKKSPFGKTFTLNGLARVYKDLRQYNTAIQLVNESIALSKQFSYRDKAKESYGILYEIYQEMGDYENALVNYKQFNLYQDSIFNEDNLQYIENLKIQYETERVTAENALLKKDAELKDSNLTQQKNLVITGIIVLFSMAGAVSFLLYGYRQKKKANQLLAEYNKNLETQVDERTTELVKTNFELIRQNNQLEQYGYITAHNLRAPVARILGLTSLLNMNAYDPLTDKHIIEKLQHTVSELDTIIHDMNAILDVKSGVENVYELIDLHDKLDKVKSILKESITNTETTIEENFSAARSCVSIPAYIESIFYNLISNAIKYRSPDRKPVINVKSEVKDHEIELVISDNGIGIDPNQAKDKLFNLYQRFHTHVEGKGIGLFLVKSQVDALNGKIEMESSINKGTTFRIFLPLN